ncbi:MAG: N-acetylmuramoyl-L-alanine amidase [Deltaproteobacteria bacterium]|nr:N-acetylmuramoyl-L-alanine amidase [Deltaproteobacteria bacterium]
MRTLGIACLVLAVALAGSPSASARPRPLNEALAAYARLSEDGPDAREPEAWTLLAGELEQAAAGQADAVAAEALFRAAVCRDKADALTLRPPNRAAAAAAFERVARQFPRSPFADHALLRLGRLREVEGDLEGARACYRRILDRGESREVAPLARRRLEESGRPAQISGVRSWSGPATTRVVVDLVGPATYRAGVLPPNAEAGRPYRLFLDFGAASLAPECSGSREVLDGLLRQVRAARFSPTTVRLVLDLEAPASFRVFRLDAPSRVVIDVFRTEALRPTVTAGTGRRDDEPRRLRIVIDPGHGGVDPGALGPGGLKEKDVVLAVALELGDRLRSEVTCEVRFTRSDDRTVSLEERTAIANAFGADLFVSIHANASRSVEAHGVETYYLERSSDRASRTLAARENASGEEGVSEIEHILTDVLLGSKVRESRRLAEELQRALVSGLRATYEGVRDLGVKRAPFYVLTGAVMPAVLVETAFLSHPVEARRLADPKYRSRTAEALRKGVQRFLNGGQKL